jgi:hypothetical protein
METLVQATKRTCQLCSGAHRRREGRTTGVVPAARAATRVRFDLEPEHETVSEQKEVYVQDPAAYACRQRQEGSVLVPSLEQLTARRADFDDVALSPDPFVIHLPSTISTAMLASANAALDKLVRGEFEGPAVAGGDPLVEKSVFSSAVWSRNSDRGWTWFDLIDPELCLGPQLKPPRFRLRERANREWQSADVDVDSCGRVCWASWVNHLDTKGHAAVLKQLAMLLEVALPAAERVSGRLHHVHAMHTAVLENLVRSLQLTVGFGMS